MSQQTFNVVEMIREKEKLVGQDKWYVQQWMEDAKDPIPLPRLVTVTNYLKTLDVFKAIDAKTGKEIVYGIPVTNLFATEIDAKVTYVQRVSAFLASLMCKQQEVNFGVTQIIANLNTINGQILMKPV